MAERDRLHWATGVCGGLLVLTLLASGCSGTGGGDVAILDINPRQGQLQGEQPVRIVGANFRTDIGYTVYFGNQKATSVTILDPETILVTTPSRDDEGVVDITIRADDGPAFQIAQAFTYRQAAEATPAQEGNLEF